MSSTTNLNISRFDAGPDAHILDWLDQFELALLVAATPEKLKKALLLTHLAPAVFKAVKTSLLPGDVMDDTITLLNVKSALKSLYHTPPNKAMARVAFSKLVQQPAETVNQFAQRLRDAAIACEFGAAYNERMMDQVTTGIRGMELRRALLTDTTSTTFEHKVAVANQEESLLRDIQACHITPPDTNAQQVQAITSASRSSTTQASPAAPCTGCGGQHHRQNCPHRQTLCYNCGKEGHLARVCRQPRAAAPPPQGRVHHINEQPTSANGAYATGVDEHPNDAGQYHGHVYGITATHGNHTPSTPSSPRASPTLGHIYSVQNAHTPRPPPIDLTLQVLIEGRAVQLHLDTGADETILPLRIFQRLGFSPKGLQPTSARLQCYSGKSLHIYGVTTARVQLGEAQRELPFFVVRQNGPALFGRSWLAAFALDAVWQAVGPRSSPPSALSAAVQASPLQGDRSHRPLHTTPSHFSPAAAPRGSRFPGGEEAPPTEQGRVSRVAPPHSGAGRRRTTAEAAGPASEVPGQGPRAEETAGTRGRAASGKQSHVSSPRRGTPTRGDQGPFLRDADADAVIQGSTYSFMSPLAPISSIAGSGRGPVQDADPAERATYAQVAARVSPQARRPVPHTASVTLPAGTPAGRGLHHEATGAREDSQSTGRRDVAPTCLPPFHSYNRQCSAGSQGGRPQRSPVRRGSSLTPRATQEVVGRQTVAPAARVSPRPATGSGSSVSLSSHSSRSPPVRCPTGDSRVQSRSPRAGLSRSSGERVTPSSAGPCLPARVRLTVGPGDSTTHKGQGRGAVSPQH